MYSLIFGLNNTIIFIFIYSLIVILNNINIILYSFSLINSISISFFCFFGESKKQPARRQAVAVSELSLQFFYSDPGTKEFRLQKSVQDFPD